VQRSLWFVVVGVVSIGTPALAQNVVLDRQVRAGDLVLFPSVRDEKVFYYAPSQPRLAEKDGKPQFSFLRYVQNVGGADGEDAAREGEGGGIVHALVTLGVTENQIERARQALEKEIKGARIEGPVAWSSGTFGLVSSFANEEGELTQSVVGLGQAPLLDGSKAAVSIQLTKLGAKVLWESFQTPTPDISFQFEMQLEGYRAPKSAIIEADFDRIYKHESFDMGLAADLELAGKRAMLGVEISNALEDLYESKAIKLTQIGDDEQLDQLVQMAYGKIVDMMFQPPNEGLAGLRGPEQQSILDRATKSLNDERKRVRESNDARRQRNEERRQAHGQALGEQERAQQLSGEVTELEQEARRLERQADEAEAHVRRLQTTSRDASSETTPPRRETVTAAGQMPDSTSADGQELRAMEADLETRPGGVQPQAESESQTATPTEETPTPTEETPTPTEETPTPTPTPTEETPTPTPTPTEETPTPTPTEETPTPTKETTTPLTPAERRAQLAQATQVARQKRTAATQARARANAARDARRQARRDSAALAGDRAEPVEENEETAPSISLMISRKLKETRHKGVFRIDLNKYTQDTRSFPFSENIGDLRRYFEDQDFFRQVNLDDPFFRQREIAVFVDGLNASDFGDYINFVSVLLRKTHDGGKLTLEEVRIDRNNFNEEGNNFRMLYGWKDDASRESWMNYEYKPTWSFFGGKEVEGDWIPTSAGAISLAPPYQPRKVTLDADPDLMKDAKVRAITVKLFYDLAGAELTKETTLNAMRGEFSRNMDFMLPQDKETYDYEIVWRLRGNKLVKSGRQESVGSILFVDELPET
jgi:hypothetical protein